MFLNFLKTVGNKIFGHDEAKPEQSGMAADMVSTLRSQALQKLLDSMHLDISNVALSVEGENVTVSGDAADQATKEKVTLTLGNVEGISAVDNNMVVPEETEESRFYEVQKGDSLWKISTEMYGDGSRYQEIVDANQPMIKNADLIYPGQQLRIP
jgi:nucleoid-associated protein YgaU